MSIDELELIENVRAYECLYNHRIDEYKHLHLRAAAWKKISSNLNATGPECKLKWNQFRNAFLHAISRRNGPVQKKIGKWKYENEMSFLLPFMSRGTRKGTLNRTIEVNCQSDDCSETQYSDEYSIEEVIPEREIKRKKYCQDETFQDKIHCTEEDQEEEEFESNEPHKVDYYKKMFQLIEEKIKQKKEDKDEIDLLFQSLAKAVKQLPKSEQVKVKVGVTTLVYDAQMRNEGK